MKIHWEEADAQLSAQGSRKVLKERIALQYVNIREGIGSTSKRNPVAAAAAH